MKFAFITLFLIFMIICADGKKISKSRSGSSRGSSRKNNYNPQPSPTSLSYPQPSAPKPSLFGWQEKPAQRTQTSSTWQSKSKTQSHSYPSSQTGLSGNTQIKQPTNNQGSNVPYNLPGQQTQSRIPTQVQTHNQQSHSYPSSNGMSGNSGSKAEYPVQGSGLSGTGLGYSGNQGNGPSRSGYPVQQGSASGHGYPAQHGSGLSGAVPPSYSGYKPGNTNQQYSGGSYGTNNFGNHPQGPPPPYSNFPSHGYGGHGSYNPGYGSQMPGYFGNYANYGKGFGGMSRTGSALTGVGIAGAGIGTILTGLALWNLARSTGHKHHTVIYDNRGQPVAVAPDNNTAPVVDPILGDLVNCTLTISKDEATEVLGIPCAIATSFSPDADVKDMTTGNSPNDNTKCTVTVVTKTGKEFMTTIPCATLLNTAAENNVTEPPPFHNETNIVNGTVVTPDTTTYIDQPTALGLASGDINSNNTAINCKPQPIDIRDPINPCYAVTHNLTVIPLQPSNHSSLPLSTPSIA